MAFRFLEMLIGQYPNGHVGINQSEADHVGPATWVRPRGSGLVGQATWVRPRGTDKWEVTDRD